MNKYLDKYLKLYLLLQKFYKGRTADYSSDAALVQALSELDTIITDIFKLNVIVEADNTGSAENKAKKKKELIEVITSVHLHLKPWFYEHPDDNSPMETRITLSAIKYATDAKLLLIGAKTYDYVQSKLPALTPYGLNSSTQTALQAAIDDFEAVSDKPLRLRDNRKKAYRELIAAIKKGNQHVRVTLTSYMSPYRVTNPDFYGDFLEDSKLGKTPKRAMALRVKVQNGAGMPISQCRISVQPAGNDKPLTAITQKTGKVHFQNLPDGLCTITATSAEGETQQQKAEIKPSERADVVFVMEG